MTTHYDTLGVPRNADPEVIKAAFRKLARQMHPDRNNGEGHDGMTALNKAYATLMDPEQRRYYDETGCDARTEEMTPEKLARSVLLHVLNEVLTEPGNLVTLVRRGLERMLERADKAITEGDEIIARNKARIAGAVRLKGRRKKGGASEDIIKMGLEAMLVPIEVKLEAIKREREAVERALATLDAYKSDEEEPDEEQDEHPLFAMLRGAAH